MELFQKYCQDAMRSFRTADHLTYITYPLVKDTKIILTILDNLRLALMNGMNTLLEYERLYKRIGPLAENFDSRYDIFFRRLVEKYNIKKEHSFLIREVKKLFEDHKKSPVEFSRKDKFVICSNDYRMQTISIQKIKEYVSETKDFLMRVNEVIGKNAI